MKALIQRVSEAKVTIDGQVVGEIEKGILVLLGIRVGDTQVDADWLARKLCALRVFRDENEKMNLNVEDVGGSFLIVSQFTLYGDTRKGTRPSYIKAARPEEAIPLYDYFLKQLESSFSGKIATGEFGAMMEVHLVNDGPVTLMLESPSVA